MVNKALVQFQRAASIDDTNLGKALLVGVGATATDAQGRPDLRARRRAATAIG
jgi:hypothetical protein